MTKHGKEIVALVGSLVVNRCVRAGIGATRDELSAFLPMGNEGGEILDGFLEGHEAAGISLIFQVFLDGLLGVELHTQGKRLVGALDSLDDVNASHSLNYFNSKNSYYLKLIKDFIINNEDYIIDQNSHVVQITSSLFGKSFIKLPNKTNISKNESISDLSNQKTTKIKQFNKINSSLVSKVFPTLFIGKEAKFILELYKEFINKRLNVISILKKLEVIQINKNNYNKSITNINQMISPLKLLSTKINNYLNNNM